MQKDANLVELEKCCRMHIFLQNFVLIQPRTSPLKNCKIFEKCIFEKCIFEKCIFEKCIFEKCIFESSQRGSDAALGPRRLSGQSCIGKTEAALKAREGGL